MENILPSSTETSCTIGHLSLALSCTDLSAQIGLAALFISWTKIICHLAEFAFSAFRGVKWNNMVSNFDISHTFTNRFNNSTTFVSTDYWEGTFGVFSRKSICVRMADLADKHRASNSIICFAYSQR